MANAKCLGVPRAQGEIILVTNASNVGGGGTLFQWQALEKEQFDSAISQWGTEGLNRDGTLKHSYPDYKWFLVPLGHWNWKWNQARGNYSTYEQELLAGMLVLSSQARLLGSNPVVWLCDQEPVRSFQKGPPPEKAKLRRWWTYLSQLRLTVHHIQGVKNECADYISYNNFDALIGARSEALAKEAFSRMDVHLDLKMTMIRPLDGLQQSEYLKEFGDIYKPLEKRLEPLLVNQDQWKRDKSYLWHKDRIVVPSDRVPALLKWTHESSGHVGADRTLRLFKQWFHTTWTDDQLRKTLQPIPDKCPCRSCKPGDIRDRGLYSTLPIPHCANSVLYVDYTEMPKFGGYDFALVVTCGLTRFTRVFPRTKHITREETIKILLEEWFCVYGAPKEINSDEDVAHLHREYDGAVTRKTREDVVKQEAAQVCCISCRARGKDNEQRCKNNTHKQQQRHRPPGNKYVICHAVHTAIAHNAIHNAVPNTTHKEGKETSVRYKPRHGGGIPQGCTHACERPAPTRPLA